MQPVVTAAEMRALDRATSEEIGLPAIAMMETAGRAVAAVVRAELAARGGGRVAVVCGPGNNGGDGFVVARVLRAAGLDVACYLAGARPATGDAAVQLGVLEKSRGAVVSIATAGELSAIGDGITGAAIAVDALFGVGLARPLAGHHAAVVAHVNRAACRIAVDVPSGLDADTGRQLGACVQAHVTVSTGPLKAAHVSAPGFATCGRVEVAEIGVPAARVRARACAWLVDEGDVARWLPRAALLDHKGTRGHVLVVGGAMRGAGRLAAATALRAGAGVVTLVGDGDVDAPDSVIAAPLAGGGLADHLAGKRAVVIGPGLGRAATARARVDEVLAEDVPAVIDADGLNAMVGDLGALAAARSPLVITPHPGEAARLLSISTADVEADRLAAARSLVARTRAAVVLKGARTIVAFGAPATCWIIAAGSPALATAGSGDVLAGAIAAMLAQGLAPHEAAACGVFAHGRAGEALAAVHGERGVVSSDLPLQIAASMAAIPRPA